MLHIGIDVRLTHYRTGGISTYMRRLVAALEHLDTANRYTILHSRKMPEPISTRFESTHLWTPSHHRLERLALSVELARFRLDVLHSPDFIPPWRGAQRHVITVHDLTFLHYPQYLTAEARGYYNDQIATAVKQADHILVDSDNTRDDLVTMLNVPAAKITVHMLGVDERFQPLDAATLQYQRQRLGLPDGYILFVGTLEPRKNIIGLLAAYRHFLETHPDAPPLVLVGRRGWLFEETQAKIEQVGLGSRLIWREDIADDDMPIIYNLARLLVLPSFYEGFGFPALEAMACGTVPIVSDRSSLPEVVGDVGLLINPDDPEIMAAAMRQALTDPDWYAANRQRGLERAQEFTWERTAAIALATYKAVAR